jgi:hypothetical protein
LFFCFFFQGADPRVVAEEFCKENGIKLPFAATIEKSIRANVKPEDLAPPSSSGSGSDSSSAKTLSPRPAPQTIDPAQSHSDVETSESLDQSVGAPLSSTSHGDSSV